MRKIAARIMVIALVCASIINLDIYAQQDAMFSHYSFNTLAVNPGYAGSRDALTITGLHRSQWVGFDGAPTTQTLTLHSPAFNNSVGLGLSVINDKIGPTNTTSFYGDFGYHIKVTEKAKLALGLKGGINLMSAQLNDLGLADENDVAFSSNIQSQLLPNFGFGAYYYTTRWYAGVSVPKLLENNFLSSTTAGSVSGASEKRHYFLIAGAVFDLGENLKLKPTTYIKVTQAAPAEADLTAMFIMLEDKLELGAMYRTGDAAGILAGYNVTEQLRIGYAFDWSFTNTTSQYNAGSHEVMLRYDFIYKGKEKIRSPRYF